MFIGGYQCFRGAVPLFKAELSRMIKLSGCYVKQITLLGQGREDWAQSRPIGRVHKVLQKNGPVIFSGICTN
jgi:hypothetical protein